MEGNGSHVEESNECGGKDVLRGVLLHVIAAAGGVDLAVQAGSGLRILERRLQVVDDVPILGVGDFRDANPVRSF